MHLAHRSHSLAAQSWEEGKLANEVMTAYAEPFKGALERDNNVRFDSTLEGYAKPKPVFDRKHGTVTAANATPLTDGASAVLMMTESRAKALGYTAFRLHQELRICCHRRMGRYVDGAVLRNAYCAGSSGYDPQ